MKQLYIFVILVFILSVACTKKDKGNTSTPEPVKLSIDSLFSSALPGDAIIVKLNKRIISNEVTVLFGTSNLMGYANGDSAYVFIVPVTAPGAVTISIPAIERSNSVTIHIKSYTPISNPQTVINNFTTKRNSIIDSITKVVSGSNFQPSAESITLITQIKEEWNTQMALLSAADKELLAYVLERNMPDPSQSSFTSLPPGYYGKIDGIQSDVGDRLVAAAKAYVTVQTVCIATIPPLVVSGLAFFLAPNPVSGLIFLGLFTTFVISRESAIRRAQEVGKLNGVAEAITGSSVQRTTAVEFFNNSEKSVTMNVGFRNLKTGDETIQADVANSFNKELLFATKDKEVEAIYNKAKAKTTKLTANYPGFNGAIGKQAPTSVSLPVDGKDIIIKSVSDSRIGFTSSLSGSTRKVKIASNSTTDIEFNMLIAYKRNLDNKEVTQNISCLYKANNCSSMDPPVITGFNLDCNSNGVMVGLISFTANGTGAVIGSGGGSCDPATNCYPVRLYFKNPGATDFSIAYNGYGVILKSGTVNQGVIEINWAGKGCMNGKTAEESLKAYYLNYEWKIELMNQCGQRSAQISF